MTMSRIPNVGDLWGTFAPISSVVCAAPILVVDDDPAQLQAITTILQTARLAVSTASSGAEALVRAAVQRPEIIVTEAILHGALCGPMLRALRSVAPQAAIVVATTLPADDARLAPALRRVRALYVPKPLEPERLLERLHRAILSGASHP